MEKLEDILKLFDTINAPYFCDYRTLKRCFRREIKKHHPDVSGNEEKAKVIITAFKKLEKIYQDSKILDYYKQMFFTNHTNSYEKDLTPHREPKTKAPTKKQLLRIGIFTLFFIITILTNDLIIGILSVIVVLSLIWGYKKT